MSIDYLDITDLKHTTQEELHEAICNAVKDTQSAVLLVPLPSTLVMTPAQFDLLNPLPDMHRMYGSKDFMYRTPLNVMEVRIRGGEEAQAYAEQYGEL